MNSCAGWRTTTSDRRCNNSGISWDGGDDSVLQRGSLPATPLSRALLSASGPEALRPHLAVSLPKRSSGEYIAARLHTQVFPDDDSLTVASDTMCVRVLQGVRNAPDGHSLLLSRLSRQMTSAATPLSLCAERNLGPEALRHRLTTAMPLFDSCHSALSWARDISGLPASCCRDSWHSD
jgi:hypothetical protein